jgi:hypothetical protein
MFRCSSPIPFMMLSMALRYVGPLYDSFIVLSTSPLNITSVPLCSLHPMLSMVFYASFCDSFSFFMMFLVAFLGVLFVILSMVPFCPLYDVLMVLFTNPFHDANSDVFNDPL